MNPINKFENWYFDEIKNNKDKNISACCLTSLGLDGYPNSRFVSLKEIIDNKFVITSSLKSRKGIELINNSKCSLTFWWPKTEKQVRIQGDAIQIETELAEKYFSERNKESKIVSHLCNQGNISDDIDDLKNKFLKKSIELTENEIIRPENWSGFYVIPKRIELMDFQESRFHIRELYTKRQKEWICKNLEP